MVVVVVVVVGAVELDVLSSFFSSAGFVSIGSGDAGAADTDDAAGAAAAAGFSAGLLATFALK